MHLDVGSLAVGAHGLLLDGGQRDAPVALAAAHAAAAARQRAHRRRRATRAVKPARAQGRLLVAICDFHMCAYRCL